MNKKNTDITVKQLTKVLGTEKAVAEGLGVSLGGINYWKNKKKGVISQQYQDIAKTLIAVDDDDDAVTVIAPNNTDINKDANTNLDNDNLIAPVVNNKKNVNVFVVNATPETLANLIDRL